MPAILRRGPTDRSSYGIRLGILNNMPDAALSGTLRQFLDVLETASPDLRVQVFLFSLPDVPRSEAGRRHLGENFYLDASQLPSAALDALVVTGTEPKHAGLKDEPYWPALASLFDWIDREGPSTIFSCLAAHAAVLHYDGIERQRLAAKCFGLFDHMVAGQDKLTAALPSRFKVAHSRCNEVPAGALVECGYRILTEAPESGVDLFVSQRRKPLVFFQGHPEYDMPTLAREYQRDVRRFLSREREAYPAEPRFYFNPAEQELLAAFRRRAEAERNEALMFDFPSLAERFRTTRGASSIAASIYGVWLKEIAEAKACERRAGREPALQHAGT